MSESINAAFWHEDERAVLHAMLTDITNLKTAVNAINVAASGDGLITTPTLSMAGTKDLIACTAFTFMVNGVSYAKTALTNGATPVETIPKDKWGLWSLSIGADGTIDIGSAADNATGYASEALAIAARPAVATDHVNVGYVTVMRAATGGFVGNTTEFDDADTTAHFINDTPPEFTPDVTLGTTT